MVCIHKAIRIDGGHGAGVKLDEHVWLLVECLDVDGGHDVLSALMDADALCIHRS